MAVAVPRQLNVDELSDQALIELFTLYEEKTEQEREDTLSRLVEQAVLIEGKKGRGKTLTAIALSWEIRQRFGRPVIAVGSKMGIGKGAGGPDAFGPHKVMNEVAFRNELEKIDVVSNEEDNAEAVAAAFDKYDISILYATLIFDEAYKLFNKRNPRDKLIQLFGFFVAQSRHYHVTIILLSPENMVDERVMNQMDWKGRVYHNPYTQTARVRLMSGLDVINYDIHGSDDSDHIPFYDMYDTHVLLGYRKSDLKIKNY